MTDASPSGHDRRQVQPDSPASPRRRSPGACLSRCRQHPDDSTPPRKGPSTSQAGHRCLNMPENMPDSASLWDSALSGTLFPRQSGSGAVCQACCSPDGTRRCRSMCSLPDPWFRPCSGTRIPRPEPVSGAVRHSGACSSRRTNCTFCRQESQTYCKRSLF